MDPMPLAIAIAALVALAVLGHLAVTAGVDSREGFAE